MANNNNMYNETSTTCCSSSSSKYSQPDQETTDDISLFLRQILLKSSSTSSTISHSLPSIVTTTTKQTQCEMPPLQPAYPSGLPVSNRIPTLSSPTGGNYHPLENIVPFVSSSSSTSLGTTNTHNNNINNNDFDDYECESEEGFENSMEEMVTKSNTARNPSKRTRAAEVHNMSEKKRRSRINEKMKALQKLIPNSNKTDKASMLDEAIEYLKQLQLRVQMLTMRNGMNLYSMSLPPPGVLQPHQLPNSRIISLNERNETINTASLNQEMHTNPMLSLPIHCTNQSQPMILDFSHIINPNPSTSLAECLISNNGSKMAQLMHSQQEQGLHQK